MIYSHLRKPSEAIVQDASYKLKTNHERIINSTISKGVETMPITQSILSGSQGLLERL